MTLLKNIAMEKKLLQFVWPQNTIFLLIKVKTLLTTFIILVVSLRGVKEEKSTHNMGDQATGRSGSSKYNSVNEQAKNEPFQEVN